MVSYHSVVSAALIVLTDQTAYLGDTLSMCERNNFQHGPTFHPFPFYFLLTLIIYLITDTYSSSDPFDYGRALTIPIFRRFLFP